MDTKEMEAAIHLLARTQRMLKDTLETVIFEMTVSDVVRWSGPNKVILQNANTNLQDIEKRIEHLVIEADE